MTKDSYIEHNKTKKQAWLIIPLGLIIIGTILFFGDYNNDTQPSNTLETSPQELLLELPLLPTNRPANWTAEWTPTSAAIRQQVLQSLSQYAADFKQLRPQLDIWAEPGSATLEKLAQRIGKALAQYHLGQVNNNINPPAEKTMFKTIFDNGVLLVCTETDRVLAKRMLEALSPYLGGNVRVRFNSELAGQSMQLYLFGTPYFTDEGQASFSHKLNQHTTDEQQSRHTDG